MAALTRRAPAVVAPAIAVVRWVCLRRRSPTDTAPKLERVPFELTVSAWLFVALLATGSSGAVLVLAAAVMFNAALMTVFGQWES